MKLLHTEMEEARNKAYNEMVVDVNGHLFNLLQRDITLSVGEVVGICRLNVWHMINKTEVV